MTTDYLLALSGGVLIGASASLMLVVLGRVAGVSGIFMRLFSGSGPGDRSWRVAFIGGLIAGGFVLRSLYPHAFVLEDLSTPLLLLSAGLLVGLGAGLANGCTSGHGVCGMSRLSKRSIVATMTFMGTAMAVTFIIRHL